MNKNVTDYAIHVSVAKYNLHFKFTIGQVIVLGKRSNIHFTVLVSYNEIWLCLFELLFNEVIRFVVNVEHYHCKVSRTIIYNSACFTNSACTRSINLECKLIVFGINYVFVENCLRRCAVRRYVCVIFVTFVLISHPFVFAIPIDDAPKTAPSASALIYPSPL